MRNILVIALSLFSVISFGQTLQDTVKVQPLSEFPEISLVSGDGTVIPVQFIRNDSSLWGRVDKDDLKTFILNNIGDIGDVLITSPTDSSILIYDQANSRWIDAPYPSISGGSGVSDGVITGATYNAGTQNIDVTVAAPGTSFSFDVSALTKLTESEVDAFVANNGYLTSYTETDPVYSAAPASGITSLNITNWNTAYGWGDHSTQGYLTSEVDGSVTNEIQDLSLTGTTLSLTGDATTVDLSVIQDGTGTDDQTAAEVAVTPVGNLNSTNVQAALQEHQADIDAISAGAGDGVATAGAYNAGTGNIDITVAAPGSSFSFDVSALQPLTEGEVDAFVANNGYLTAEVDGSTTNEIQTIDEFAITGSVLSLSLTNDGQAPQTVDLADLPINPNFDFIQLNTAFVNTDFSVGEIGWSENDEVRIGILDNYDFAVGQDMYKSVHNTTVSDIPAGTALKMTGADGNSGIFTVAPIDYPATDAQYFVGVAGVAIPAGSVGVAVQNGAVRGINTSIYSLGQVLYLDEVNAGGLTTTPSDVLVAAVTSVGTNGSIYVRPDFYAGLSQAEADAVGAMVSGNTETLIDVTYQADNTIDFVVNNDLSLYDNTTSGFLTSEVDGSVTNEIQDLQSVTDQGATTTNAVNFARTIKVGDNQLDLANGSIEIESTVGPSTFLTQSNNALVITPDPGGNAQGFVNFSNQVGKTATDVQILNGGNFKLNYVVGSNNGGKFIVDGGSTSNGASLHMTVNNTYPTISSSHYGTTGVARDLRFDMEYVTKMVLDVDGNFGVNVLDPQYRLDVDGTVRLQNISDGSSFDQILARNSTTGEIGFTTDQTGTDDQQIFFNSETNVLSIESANNVDLSSLAAGGGLTWDDQTEVLYAEALTIPATTFTDPTYADSRNFHAVLNTLDLSNATLELPTPSATYEKYYIAVTCIDGGTGFCRVTNTGTAASPVVKTMSNNDRAYLLCHKIDDIDTYAWTMTETFAALPESQTLSWSAGTDRNDEITLSDGGGTITVTDDQQLSWNSLTNVLSLTNSATADLNDLLQGIIISGNSVVIQGGPAGANTVPIVNTVESVTSTNTDAIVNLQGSYNRIAQIDLTASTGAVTLSVSNPVSGGVYTFHFQNVTSTDLTFPGTFLDAAGSTLGTVPMTANNWYTCYYDGSNYHCK